MRVAITGATGLVGRFFVEHALAQGHEVTVLSRAAPKTGFFTGPVDWHPFNLGDAPAITADALVHCAFSHIPGRYRGGEGDDPDGFRRANLDGSITLFRAARDAGIGRVVFLSSRAVYGQQPTGLDMGEDAPCAPTSLYGEVKLRAEEALTDLSGPSFIGQSLRATGVYGPAGPGRPHKWSELFHNFRQGHAIDPRQGTEVHGRDLANTLSALQSAPSGAYNVSDILVDRRDLLQIVAEVTGANAALPPRATGPFSAMDTGKLRALDWRPGGWPLLRQTLRQIA